jgi:cadmium resistance protein CadD (predicted permease)
VLSVIGLAVVLFASTNIDDVFVLLAFFADRKVRTSVVVAGQYLGMSALICVSSALSLASLVLSPQYIGLLGVLPILVGLKKLIDLWRYDDHQADHLKTEGSVSAVASVTVANGGDNIGVYTPVFATQSASDIALTAIVFAIMTAFWLFIAHVLVHHPQLGAPIRRYGLWAMPFILIALGLHILCEAGSVQLLGNLV